MVPCKFVRLHFYCESITKIKVTALGIVYSTRFRVVDSPENRAFWEGNPPLGRLEVSGVGADLLEVGRDYYLDLTLIEG